MGRNLKKIIPNIYDKLKCTHQTISILVFFSLLIQPI